MFLKFKKKKKWYMKTTVSQSLKNDCPPFEVCDNHNGMVKLLSCLVSCPSFGDYVGIFG